MKTCYSAQLTTTAQKIISCEFNQRVRIDLLWLNNASSSNDSYTIYHVKAGDSPADSNTLAYQTAINSKRTAQFEGPLYLGPGDTLQALAATASRVNIHVYCMVSTDDVELTTVDPINDVEIRYE